MIVLYGIPNCDTVKKAKKFLEAQGVDYDFFDFKKKSPTKTQLASWKKFYGELPVNKRGTTYRKFKDDYESASEAQKQALLLENLSAIKRPILEKDKKVIAIGFDEESYSL